MADVDALWDFDDPAGSERRFRESAASAADTDRAVLLTQAARALGLQERYAEGHALLDELRGGADQAADRTLDARIALERGRLHRSAGEPEQARGLFEAAAESARAAGDEALEIDALHMAAIAQPDPAIAVRLNQEALRRTRDATEPRARGWEASLLNNLGCALVDAEQLDEALEIFEAAVAVRETRGERREAQIGRWMVAWTLRLLGRRDEALTLQRALKEELTADGVEDPYVDEEIALLTTEPA